MNEYQLFDWENETGEGVGPDSWLTIADADGEEVAVIMCRDFERVQREAPEHIARKERNGRMIVDALNRRGQA